MIDIGVNTQQAQVAVSKLESEFNKLEKRTETLTQALGKSYLETQKLEKDFSTLQSSYAKLSAENTTLSAKVNVLTADMARLDLELKKTNADLAAQAAVTSKVTSATQGLSIAQKSLHDATRGVSGAFGSLWMTYGQILPLLTGFMAAASAVKVFKTGSEFEYINTMTSALSNGEVAVKDLNAELLKMKGLGRTPTELAEGVQSLVKAGRSASQALKEIQTVSMFSTIADNMSLDKAADELVRYHNVFKSTTTNMKGDSASLSDIADILTSAVHGSTAGFSDFNTALKYTLPLVSTAKFSFQEVSAAAMVFADSGLQGSIGTTAMRTALTNMITPTHAIKEALKSSGVEMEKFVDGDNIKSLGDMVNALKKVKEQMSAEQWLAFAKEGFGLRGSQLTALIDKTDEYGKHLQSLGDAAGGVEQKFKTLAATTKMRMEELGASFERAFITAFNGEKATAVISELDKLVNSSGFASSLQDIVTGAIGLSESFTKIAGVLLSVPTWVLEVGVVGAFLFGKTGKIAAAAIVGTAAAIEGLKTKIEDLYYASAPDAVDPRSKSPLEGYKKEAEELQARMDELTKNHSYSESTDKRLKYVFEQISNFEAASKSLTDVSNKAAGVLPKKTSGENSLVVTESQKETEKLAKLTAGLFEYSNNLDNRRLANRLENLETEKVSTMTFLDSIVGKEAEVAVAKRLYMQKYNNERVKIQEEDTDRLNKKTEAEKKSDEVEVNRRIALGDKIRKEYETFTAKELELENRLTSEIGITDDVKLARKIDNLDKEYEKTKSMIDAQFAYTGDVAKKEDDMDKAFHDNAIQRGDLLTSARIKQSTALKDFNDQIKEMSNEAGIGNVSELQTELDKIDKTIDSMKSKLKADGVVGKEFEKATKEAEALRIELKKIQEAKLGSNIFDGFIAGVKESQRQALTLGKIGAQLGETFSSELATTFKDIFKGKNENPYASNITSISDKIKDMQYQSLEGGQAQLEWLRKDYDATLQGAMEGNQEMFDDYMGNLDEYLAKAEETMSPEDFQETYAKTMEDLKALNEEFAGSTESTWDRISDSFGNMADRMLDKFLDMVAQMAAQDLINSVFSAFGGTAPAAGGGSGITGAAISTAVSTAGTVAAEYGGEAMDWIGSLWAADGGYIQAHQGGGKIVGGSGNADDVFLGMMGNTAAFGMGGEYIVNKKATAKFLPLLEDINSVGFASGGKADGNFGYTKTRDFDLNSVVSFAASHLAEMAITKATAAILGATGIGLVAAPLAKIAAVAFDIQETIMGWIDAQLGVVTSMTMAKEALADLTGDVFGLDEGFNDLSGMFSESIEGLDAFNGAITGVTLGTEEQFAALSESYAVHRDTIAAMTSELGINSSAFSTSTFSVGAFGATLDTSVAQVGGLVGALGQFSFATQETLATSAYSADLSLEGAVVSDAASMDAQAAAEAAEGWADAAHGWMEAAAAEHAAAQASFDANSAAVAAAQNEAQMAAGVAIGGWFSGMFSRDSQGNMGGGGGGGNGTTGSVGSDGMGHNGESGEASGWNTGGWLGYADGGWLGKFGSGWINQGSGTSDDVFLGYSDGGRTRNFGMGGEFVVNKRSAAKHSQQLEAINRDFANGGVVEDQSADMKLILEELKYIMLSVAKNSKKSSDALNRIEYVGIPTSTRSAVQ